MNINVLGEDWNMNVNELRKAYDKEWKEKSGGKYIVWLICYIGGLVPLLVACLQLLGGLNDQKIFTIIICMAIFFVMEIIAAVIGIERKKGLKAYLDLHKNQ